jgi:hypothetical protein
MIQQQLMGTMAQTNYSIGSRKNRKGMMMNGPMLVELHHQMHQN